MTNHLRFRLLLDEAEQIASELDGLVVARHWNLAIRRGQEVVELALKAVLLWLGADYPKSHDVGGLAARLLRERGVVADESFLSWVETFSSELATKRAPAFYGEQDFGETDARAAAQGSRELLAWAMGLVLDRHPAQEDQGE